MKTSWSWVACSTAIAMAVGCSEASNAKVAFKTATQAHSPELKSAPVNRSESVTSPVNRPELAITKPETELAPAGKDVRSLAVRRFDTETYDAIVENPFLSVLQNPLSTFSIDVDTASYSVVRRFLQQGQLPPEGAVRIEELINYFPYRYTRPSGDEPFAVNVELADCPWNPNHRLARIGLKGREIHVKERPASNLVFLLDVSGSMSDENKLPLVKSALKMLVDRLGENDRVAIVIYAGASGVALPSTNAHERATIVAAIDGLSAEGSTNAGDGIQLAYAVAAKHFIKGGANRIILCTDGDFNVGVTSQSELIRLIQDEARSGVFLTVLGFGMGNYKDSTMEKLADNGNGNYAYIDTLEEARKVLVDQLSGTLVTIAKDVKIQVDFNPRRASGYRLVGYENRLFRSEDFRDDRKDAGEIGAGHTVTALYEIVPAGQSSPGSDVDPSKYQKPAVPNDAVPSPELLTVRLRYKSPDGAASKSLDVPVIDGSRPFDSASEDYRFAASVAAFGMLLRDSPHRGRMDLDGVLRIASGSIGPDRNGYRAEFLELVKITRRLKPSRTETAAGTMELGPRHLDAAESSRQPARTAPFNPRAIEKIPPRTGEESYLRPADVLFRLAILCLLAVLLLCPDYLRNQLVLDADRDQGNSSTPALPRG